MNKRVISVCTAASLLFFGCVVSTETVPGETGPQGAPADIWSTCEGGICYSGDQGIAGVAIGATSAECGNDLFNCLTIQAKPKTWQSEGRLILSNALTPAVSQQWLGEILFTAPGNTPATPREAVSIFGLLTAGGSDDPNDPNYPNYGGRLMVATKPNDSTSIYESMSITSATISFSTSNEPRVAITSKGNVGFGTTNPVAKVEVNGADWNSDSAPLLWIENLNADAQTYAMAVGSEKGGGDLFALRARGGGTAALDLYLNGQAYKPDGGSWTTGSDARLKKNIAPLGSALDRVLRLRGVTFEWIEPAKHGYLTGTQTGLIAQEVEKVFPEWVGTDAAGFRTLTIRGFEALAIESFRTLKTENDALRERVTALEKREDRAAKLEADLNAEREERRKLEARLSALEAILVSKSPSHSTLH